MRNRGVFRGHETPVKVKEAGQLEALDIKMDHYSGDPLAQANRGRGMNPAMLNMV